MQAQARGRARTRQLELGGQDLALQLRAALGAEGRRAAQHLVQQDAHAPPVHRLAVPLARHDLRGPCGNPSKPLARTGGVPHSISCSRMPTLHQSTALPTPLPATTCAAHAGAFVERGWQLKAAHRTALRGLTKPHRSDCFYHGTAKPLPPPMYAHAKNHA